MVKNTLIASAVIQKIRKTSQELHKVLCTILKILLSYFGFCILLGAFQLIFRNSFWKIKSTSNLSRLFNLLFDHNFNKIACVTSLSCSFFIWCGMESYYSTKLLYIKT